MTRAVLCSLLLASPAAFAAEDDDAATARDAATSAETVREINRGFYLKSNIGSTLFLLTYGGGLLSGVMTVNLTAGSDFVDNERSSLAWEVTFGQSLQNGIKWDEQVGVLAPNQYLQGDLHIFSGGAALEASTYLTRRFGLGIKVGGGAAMAPTLIQADALESTVIPAWGGATTAINGGVLPFFGGGPTIEYYTKLSHFSVGVDVDANYYLTLNDLGVTPSGYMKYTF